MELVVPPDGSTDLGDAHVGEAQQGPGMVQAQTAQVLLRSQPRLLSEEPEEVGTRDTAELGQAVDIQLLGMAPEQIGHRSQGRWKMSNSWHWTL